MPPAMPPPELAVPALPDSLLRHAIRCMALHDCLSLSLSLSPERELPTTAMVNMVILPSLLVS